MRSRLLFAATFCLAGTLVSVQAGDKEDLAAAIKKLAEAESYTWTSTTQRPESEGEDQGRR